MLMDKFVRLEQSCLAASVTSKGDVPVVQEVVVPIPVEEISLSQVVLDQV